MLKSSRFNGGSEDFEIGTWMLIFISLLLTRGETYRRGARIDNREEAVN